MQPEEFNNQTTMTLFQSSNINFSFARGNEGGPVRTATLQSTSLSTDLDPTLKQALGFPDNAKSSKRRMGNHCCISIDIQLGSSFEFTKDCIRVRDTYPNGLLEKLSKHFGGNLQITTQIWNVGLSKAYKLPSPETVINLDIPEGEVACFPADGTYGYEFHPTTDVFKRLRGGWGNNKNVCPGEVKISVGKKVFHPDAIIEDRVCINRKILKDEIDCDVTIIPRNGVAVKCHKIFLRAHSAALLEANIQTNMTGSETNIVKMQDMSEESVRAFVAYLYFWDVEVANKSSLVAYELLKVGLKYDILKLEETMERILLMKENSWFDVEVAMQLFLFARNRPEGEQLKMKAVQVLKANFVAVKKSETYKNLFKNDPQASNELCDYAFST